MTMTTTNTATATAFTKTARRKARRERRMTQKAVRRYWVAMTLMMSVGQECLRLEKAAAKQEKKRKLQTPLCPVIRAEAKFNPLRHLTSLARTFGVRKIQKVEGLAKLFCPNAAASTDGSILLNCDLWKWAPARFFTHKWGWTPYMKETDMLETSRGYAWQQNFVGAAMLHELGHLILLSWSEGRTKLWNNELLAWRVAKLFFSQLGISKVLLKEYSAWALSSYKKDAETFQHWEKESESYSNAQVKAWVDELSCLTPELAAQRLRKAGKTYVFLFGEADTALPIPSRKEPTQSSGCKGSTDGWKPGRNELFDFEGAGISFKSEFYPEDSPTSQVPSGTEEVGESSPTKGSSSTSPKKEQKKTLALPLKERLSGDALNEGKARWLQEGGTLSGFFAFLEGGSPGCLNAAKWIWLQAKLPLGDLFKL